MGNIVIVGDRKVLGVNFSRQQGVKKQAVRPRSRTLTAVQDAILEDIVYPTEIVGKRLRISSEKKTLKVFLDPKDSVNIEQKLDAFASVYTALTKKRIVFDFPSTE